MEENDAWYRGDVSNCIRHGRGLYNYPFGGQKLFSYEGSWNQGVKEGNGTFQIKGHSTYSGAIQNGEISGHGIRDWSDGRHYEGEWLNGEMHGKGFWINNRTNEVYDGGFADNRRNGFGSLQRNIESYKGMFLNHKFHGAGTYVYANKYMLEGNFEENVLQGKVTIDWQKIARMSGDWADGQPHGHAYFSAVDGSFDFEGSWVRGLPELTQTSGKLWLTVDRSLVDAENAAKTNKDPKGAKDKKKAAAAPPAKKGKGEISLAEPTFIAQHGEGLGCIDVRCVSAVLPSMLLQQPVVAVETKKGPGKGAPAAPVIEAPPLFGVSSEHIRRVRIRLRPILEPDAAITDAVGTATASKTATTVASIDEPKKAHNLGSPVVFWLKAYNQEEFSTRKNRFSPLSIVVMCDNNKSDQSWGNIYTHRKAVPAEGLSFVSIPVDDDGFSHVNTTKHNTTTTDANSPSELQSTFDESKFDSVSSYSLSRDSAAVLSVDCMRIKRGSECISFVVDFNINSVLCMQQHIARYQEDGYYRESKRSMSKAAPSGTKSGNNLLQPSKSATNMFTSTKPTSPTSAATRKAGSVSKSFKSRDMEILVCSFVKPSQVYKKDCKRLDLVLVVPAKNLEAYYIMERDSAAVAIERAAAMAEKSRRASFMGSVDVSADEPEIEQKTCWVGCYWELRCTIVSTTFKSASVNGDRRRSVSIGSVQSLSSQFGQDLPITSEAVKLVAEDVSPPNMAVISDADPDAVPADAIADDLSVVTAPLPEMIPTSVSTTTVCGQWQCSDINPDEWHSLALSVREHNEGQHSADKATTVSGAGGANPASADLVMDGQGMIRRSEDTSTPSKTQQNALSSWLEDYPLAEIMRTQSQDSLGKGEVNKKSNNRKTSVSKTTSEVIAGTEPEFHMNTLLVVLGSSDFNGQAKGVAICTRQDRCDLLQATNCYADWRATQQNLDTTSKHPSDSESIAAETTHLPKYYSLASEVFVDLFCGSGEVSFDRIRIPTAPPPTSTSTSTATSDNSVATPLIPEGLYVVEVSDAVNSECVVATAAVEDANEAVSSAEKRLPIEALHMTRVIRSLPTNTDIVVKIETATEV